MILFSEIQMKIQGLNDKYLNEIEKKVNHFIFDLELKPSIVGCSIWLHLRHHQHFTGHFLLHVRQM